MQELLNNALGFIRAVLRFRWSALLLAWLIAMMGWAYVYQLEYKFQARARIFVDSNRILKPLLEGIAIQPDVAQRVTLMSKTLLSRPNLEKLVLMSDLDIAATTDLEKEQLLTDLNSGIILQGERRNASLYTVRYTHSEPAVAKRVVQSLITIFIETTLGDEREDSEVAQSFLVQQLELYETRLSEAEQRLSRFRQENAGKMPGESGGYFQRLEAAVSNERSARLERREAQNRLDVLLRQLRDESPTIAESSVAAGASPLEEQLQQQNAELAGLLLRYTERHPKVAQLRDSITDLESRVEAIANGTRSQRPRLVYIPSPVYQELRTLAAESEARVAELDVRVLEFERQVLELEDTVESIPKVEARLLQLDRDYTIVKGQYETLLRRREAARMSEQVEQNVDDVKFRVIDPPFVSSRPISPKKDIMTLGIFGGSLGLGAALAFMLSLLRPVFYDAETIASKTGRSILGSVSKLNNGRLSTRRTFSWLMFLGLLMLLGTIALVLVAYYRGIIRPDHFDMIRRSALGPILENISSVLAGLVEQLKTRVGGFLGSI